MEDFNGKVAVITGAGSGIGAALAVGLAAAGMRVVAADIDGEAVAATTTAIGAAAMAATVNVADQASVDRLADEAFGAWGQVDLLINNAGVFQGGLTWERSRSDWDWVFGVNVFGIVHAIRSFVPRMLAQDTDGHVVNTASVAAFVAGAASAPYVVSKCAAFSLSECLALDLAAVGAKIGVSVLTPSAVDTNIARTARVRPAAYGSDDTTDGRAVADALAQITGAGMAPADVVAPVLAGIRNRDFLIPTKPSYTAQIDNRYRALLARRLPGPVTVD